jgi:hypothetical protein
VLQTTDLRENPERVFWVWHVQLQCLLHYIEFEFQGLVVDARAAARGLLRLVSCEGGDQGRCWRGVPDAHVSRNK